jgi:hypothetical protein
MAGREAGNGAGVREQAAQEDGKPLQIDAGIYE